MKLKFAGTLVAAALLAGFIPALSGCSTETSIVYTLYNAEDEVVQTYRYSEEPTDEEVEDVEAEDGYYYIVSGYLGKPVNLVIPAEIGGVQVNGVGEQAFANCSSLKTVVIEEGVKTAGQAAFLWCQSLVSVSIPSTMNVSDSMFGMCVLLQSVTIEEGVTSIGNRAFQQCYNLAELNADEQSSFNLPSTLTSIGGYAFYNCYAIDDDIVIPDGVETVREYSFAQGSDEWYTQFYESTSQSGTITSVTLGEGVTEIGEAAFGGLSGVVSVTLSDSLVKIGDGAFSYCTSLGSITIPGETTFIGASAFEGCAALTSVTFEAFSDGSLKACYLYEEELDEDEEPGSDSASDKLFDYNYFDSTANSSYIPSYALADSEEAASLLIGDCYEAYWYLVAVQSS